VTRALVLVLCLVGCSDAAMRAMVPDAAMSTAHDTGGTLATSHAPAPAPDAEAQSQPDALLNIADALPVVVVDAYTPPLVQDAGPPPVVAATEQHKTSNPRKGEKSGAASREAGPKKGGPHHAASALAASSHTSRASLGRRRAIWCG
jgi:hypothetical protein